MRGKEREMNSSHSAQTPLSTFSSEPWAPVRCGHTTQKMSAGKGTPMFGSRARCPCRKSESWEFNLWCVQHTLSTALKAVWSGSWSTQRVLTGAQPGKARCSGDNIVPTAQLGMWTLASRCVSSIVNPPDVQEWNPCVPHSMWASPADVQVCIILSHGDDKSKGEEKGTEE